MAETGVTAHLASGDLVSAHRFEELNDRLDELWIIYLKHLEVYTEAQKQIQKHMSSYFLSLAKANFTLRGGRRYGKDYYHEKAIASRRTRIEVSENEHVEIASRELSVSELIALHETEEDDVHEKNIKPLEQVEVPDENSLETKEDDSTKAEKHIPDHSRVTLSATVEKPPLEADPLRWFGLLVPQELRTAQSTSRAVFDGPVFQAANAARRMRETEVEIRKLRKIIRRVAKGIAVA